MKKADILEVIDKEIEYAKGVNPYMALGMYQIKELIEKMEETNENDVIIDDGLPDILTAKHIANYLHISRRRVYELMDLKPEFGGIPCFSIGASKRVIKKDFKEWINLKVER